MENKPSCEHGTPRHLCDSLSLIFVSGTHVHRAEVVDTRKCCIWATGELVLVQPLREEPQNPSPPSARPQPLHQQSRRSRDSWNQLIGATRSPASVARRAPRRPPRRWARRRTQRRPSARRRTQRRPSALPPSHSARPDVRRRRRPRSLVRQRHERRRGVPLGSCRRRRAPPAVGSLHGPAAAAPTGSSAAVGHTRVAPDPGNGARPAPPTGNGKRLGAPGPVPAGRCTGASPARISLTLGRIPPTPLPEA